MWVVKINLVAIDYFPAIKYVRDECIKKWTNNICFTKPENFEIGSFDSIAIHTYIGVLESTIINYN